MATGYQGNGHDGETRPSGATTAVQDQSPAAPPETLVASSVGDRCVNCGATLQSDQRYCVVCGERRGAPRFTLPSAVATSEVTTISTSTRAASRGPRFGSATTLIAGVGTLLLALLVGFLIGNAASKNNTKTVAAKSPPVKIYNVGGGGGSSGAGSSAGTSSTPSSSSSTKSSAGGSHKSKAKVSKTVTKKQAAAESNAAAKVTGGNGTPPPTTKVGQKCSGSSCKQAGYNKKTHKFDGSFFGQ